MNKIKYHGSNRSLSNHFFHLYSFFILIPSIIYANSDRPISIIGNDFFFSENKGQIADQNNNPNPSVLYLLNTPGFNVQLKRNGFSYDIYQISDIDDKTPNIQFHRLDFIFLNYDPNCEIIALNATSDYHNYYGSFAPSSGIINIRQFQKIVYKNIYPSIDLEFLISNETGYKYNFIIRQGGDINDIRIKIEGADDILLITDTLKLSTSMGDVDEVIPNSFFLDSDTSTHTKAHFVKKGHGLYGFSLDDDIPGNSTLVIDPTCLRLWGTYYGGSSSEYGWDSSTDTAGNVIITGQTKSLNNIATTGSFQSVYLGINWRGYLVKFDANGIRQWGTYFQGSVNGDDRGLACQVGPSGNIYLAGVTTSDTGIATPGAHQTIFGGTPGITDVFLAKFNSSGQRIWATYFGGWGDDLLWGEGGGLSTDKDENVFLAGQTSSITGIATPGAYQTTITGTSGFLTKFDSSGVQLWGTYYSGDVTTQFYGCATDTIGNVYAAGMTNSSTNIASPGAFQPIIGGLNDAFLVSFNSTGQRNWGTYFGGALNDWGRNCTCDNDGFIYLVGWTTSVAGIASPGSYQSTIGGGQDGFLIKFDKQGQRIWGTYVGGLLSDEVIDCSVGSDGDIFICGQTESQDNISTLNSFQPNIGGGFDAFITKFNTLGQRQWGTYFGGTNDEWGGSCNYVSHDTIYLQGNTQSLDNIATSNGHQVVFGGGIQDAFLEKFIDCWPISASQAIFGPDSICQNTVGVIFSIGNFAHAVSYQWGVPDGATIVSGSGTTSIAVDFGYSAISGYISVKGLNKCGDVGDSSFLYVSLQTRPVPSVSGSDSSCTGQSFVYSTLPGKSQYQWAVSPGGTGMGGGTTIDTSQTVLWNIPGPQWISINYTDTNGCAGLNPTIKNIEVSIEIPVNVTITASLNNICQGTPVTFTATPVNGGSTPAYQWRINAVNATNATNAVFTYIPVNGDQVSVLRTSSIVLCTSNNPATSNAITMVVNPLQPVTLTVSPSSNPVCAGATVNFVAIPLNGGSSPQYEWKVNGLIVGINAPNYSYVPVQSDAITCTLTSNVLCPSGNPAVSGTVTMTVSPILPVGVSIVASSNPFCAGSPVTFTASPINAGFNPAYQWKINAVNANNATNAVFTYSPANGDQVSVVCTSSIVLCTSNNPATSDPITMTALPAPEVSFTTCFDTVTILSAKPFMLKGGTPLGGFYSGLGVNPATGTFTPSVAGTGLKTIQYAYTNASSCSATMSKTILVKPDPPFTCGNPLTDLRDNKVYPTVQIGSQCWMQINLDFGIQISDFLPQTDNCISEKYSAFNADHNEIVAGQISNLKSEMQNGAFYQWDELMRHNPSESSQGLCPPGWHIPSSAEWDELIANCNGPGKAGGTLKDTLLPGGFHSYQQGLYFLNNTWSFTAGFAAGSMYWTSTLAGGRAIARGINEMNLSVSKYEAARGNGFSARCLKDNAK